MAEDESKLTIETLISRAGNSNYIRDPDIWSRYLGLANAKMGMESNQLTQRTQELTEEQIKISNRTNELTEELLLSNEQASKDSKTNAELMNKATQQLANSTKWLTIATFVLVFFAAVQAFITFLALYKK